MDDRLRNAVGVFATTILVVAGVLVLGVSTEIVGIRYPEIVDDQPLENPVRVTDVAAREDNAAIVTLEDGRRLDLEFYEYHTVAETLEQTQFRVDVVPRNGSVLVFGNRDGWVCGAPWAQPIVIPLIPDTVYRNRREIIASGDEVE